MATQSTDKSPTAALLETLPAEVGGQSNGLMPNLQLIEGVTVVWIRYDPVDMSRASKDGFHLPKADDKFILNADQLQESPEGYLVYGDAIPAIVRTDSLKKRSEAITAKYNADLAKPESPHTQGERVVISRRKLGEDEPEHPSEP